VPVKFITELRTLEVMVEPGGNRTPVYGPGPVLLDKFKVMFSTRELVPIVTSVDEPVGPVSVMLVVCEDVPTSAVLFGIAIAP
jgi:hypothetical protein